MTNIYYIVKQENDIPFYVGKTVNLNSRLYEHKRTYGKGIKLIVLDTVGDNEWGFWEKFYIRLFKSWGFKLLNQNEGGGGTTRASPQKILKLKLAKSKPILQYNLNGNFIKEWNSSTEYALLNNLTNGTLITSCLKGKSPTAYNSIWKYKTENYPLVIELPIHKGRKPILQYDMNGNIVREWNSAQEVYEILGFRKQNINNNLSGRSKNAYGFIWRYK